MAIHRQELERQYEALEGPLYNFALRCTWNPAAAQELVQDAFLNVWDKREKVEPSTLRGLLYTMVLNQARNERRRAQLKEKIPLLDWVIGGKESGPDREFLAREGQGRVRAAIEALPEELREVLLLSQFSDLSLEEVGAALGIPEGTVASRKHRAVGLLREKLGEGEI